MVTGGRLRLSGIAPVARNPGARVRRAQRCGERRARRLLETVVVTRKEGTDWTPSFKNENAFPNRVT